MNNCHNCGTNLMPHCGQNCPKCKCQLRPSPCGGRCAPGNCSCDAPQLPRARVEMCDGCDPCQPCESMVRICTHVVPTLADGRFFRNSFIYNQEDESVYYISDKGDELSFGSRPLFINGFNPTSRVLKQQIVFDVANVTGYAFDLEGNYATFPLSDTAVSELVSNMITAALAPYPLLPAIPTADGNYVLTVTDGVATWSAQ